MCSRVIIPNLNLVLFLKVLVFLTAVFTFNEVIKNDHESEKKQKLEINFTKWYSWCGGECL
jgi:hypothetical protein